jgi:hypothetical protein
MVKDLKNQRNSEYLNGQRPAMMLPWAIEFDLWSMGQSPRL